MSSPEAFTNRGLSILTQWAQLTDQLDDFAAVFEARGGADGILAAKITPAEGQQLTPEQEAYNEQVEQWALAALDVVTHHNDLMTWYQPPQRVRVAIRRIDY